MNYNTKKVLNIFFSFSFSKNGFIHHFYGLKFNSASAGASWRADTTTVHDKAQSNLACIFFFNFAVMDIL
jgi:hypothetical protein